MVISGKELSMEMKRQMAVRVKELEQKYGRVPHLVVVLVGEDPGSVSEYHHPPSGDDYRSGDAGVDRGAECR